jgi:hypothetical protein
MARRLADRFVSLVVLAMAISAGPAWAHDIPDRISLHAFARPEGERMHLVVRVPLTLLLNLNLPKRGPGYLDLAQVEARIPGAAAALARDLALFEDGQLLMPVASAGRISVPSDRSFESYERARENIAGSRLPESTNVFWNQGFFDAHLQYAIRSERGDFALELLAAPGLGDRLTLDVRFRAPDGGERAYLITPATGRVALDPRWHQAASSFVASGTRHILGGLDHLLFLVCLIVPFRRLGWQLLAVVTSFTVAHSVTLIASALGWVPAGEWFPPLVEVLIAASILYMAIENAVAPNLDRRWLITGLFGLVHGFGFSFMLKDKLQFAGDHLLVSLLAFNVGVEIGQVLVVAAALPLLGLLARHSIVERAGLLVISILVGHTAWHWLGERTEILWRTRWPAIGASTLMALASIVAIALLVGGAIRWAVARRSRRTAPLAR